MPETPKSSGEQHINTIMETLEPGSDRYEVLDKAKRFKSSWVELGEKLLQVSTKGFFREWGYQDFEEYCVQEIRIKRGTAIKLTMAYRFMEKEEPQLLSAREELKPLPDYRSIELGVYALYTSRQHLPLKLRYLIDFLAEAFRRPAWR